jgi:hypothetical protein
MTRLEMKCLVAYIAFGFAITDAILPLASAFVGGEIGLLLLMPLFVTMPITAVCVYLLYSGAFDD